MLQRRILLTSLSLSLLSKPSTAFLTIHPPTFRPPPLPSIKEDDSLLDAEIAAAFDAHDLSDPGMEAAAMERAVMLAEEMRGPRRTPSIITHDDTEEELLDAENAGVVDAHDLSDPGMEAAAMERAVMLAQDFRENHPRMGRSDEVE